MNVLNTVGFIKRERECDRDRDRVIERERERVIEREMADLFVKQAKEYSETRPSYPPELFEFIASKTPGYDLAWDVGTGSGQAATSVRLSLSLNFHFFIYFHL